MAVAYDAVGAGAYTASSTASSWSYSHSATAGAYVVIAVCYLPNGTPTLSVTYDGNAPTLLGSATSSTGADQVSVNYYGISGVAGGSKTVAVSSTASIWLTVNSVSFTGVDSVATPTTTSATASNALSQSVTGTTSGQMILQSFGERGDSFGNVSASGTFSGGTSRYLQASFTAPYSFAQLSLRTATADTTFTASNGTYGESWCGIAAVLSPPTSVTVSPSGASLATTMGSPPVSGPQTVYPGSPTLATTMGTPLITTPTVFYDTVGGGYQTTTAANPGGSWNHNAAAGADVITQVTFLVNYPNTGATITGVTYNSVAATFLGYTTSHTGNNQVRTEYWHSSGVASGSKVVAVSSSAAIWMSANSISFTGVLSLGTLNAITEQTGSSLSQTVSGVSVGQMVLQTFGQSGDPNYGTVAPLTSFSGGTVRWYGHAQSGPYSWAAGNLTTSTSSSTTFTTSNGANGEYWGALALVLSPVAVAGPVTVAPSSGALTVVAGSPAVSISSPSPLIQPGSVTLFTTRGSPAIGINPNPGTVVLDKAAVGASAAGTGSITIPFTPSAGTYLVIGVIGVGFVAPTSVTFGATTATQIALGYTNSPYGTSGIYGVPNVAGTTQNVTVTLSTTGWAYAVVASYFNVNSVGTAQIANGSTSPASQAVTVDVVGAKTIQVFGTGDVFNDCVFSALSGGTNRFNGPAAASNQNYTALVLNEFSSNGTASASVSPAANWVGMAVSLDPPPQAKAIAPAAASLTTTMGVPLLSGIPILSAPVAAALSTSLGSPIITGQLQPVSVAPTGATLTVAGGSPFILTGTPLSTLLTKLRANQNAEFSYVGDSTSVGYGDSTGAGWEIFLTWIAQFLDTNEIGLGWTQLGATGQWAPTGTTIRSTARSGAPTLLSAASGQAGTTLDWDLSAVGEGMLTTPNVYGLFPDVFVIWDGFNDGNAGVTGQAFADKMQTLITNARAAQPTMPILVCTQNQAYYDTSSQWQLVAQTIGAPNPTMPLNPPLQASATQSNVWILDTTQAFAGYNFPSVMYDGLHPNSIGYRLLAMFMIRQLTPDMATWIIYPGMADATISYGANGTPLALTGNSPIVTTAFAGSISPNPASLVISPGTFAGYRLPAAGATAALSGGSPVVSVLQKVFPAAAALTATPTSPLIVGTFNQTVAPVSAHLTLQPALLLLITSGPKLLQPTGGVLTLLGGTMWETGVPVIPPIPTGPVKVRYPQGPITPHGACYVLDGRLPMMTYRSYDDSAVFNLGGGPAIPDQTMPEAILLTGLKGLIPPWQSITQKGATQDGSTYIDSLYDPVEVELELAARGRDARWCRKVLRDWIDSWDAKQTGELSWFTHDLGRWWAPIQWHKQPVDKLLGGNFPYQKFNWSAIAYDGFWRSYDDVGTFGFLFNAAYETFDMVTSGSGDANDLGPNWSCAYSGPGGGWISANNAVDIFGIQLNFPFGGTAYWTDDPTHPVLPAANTVVCQRKNFTTVTDNQVVTLQLGSFEEWSYPDTAYTDLWARMDNGTPGFNGVRLRFGIGTISLSYFVGGVETILRIRPLLIPPLAGEWWTLVCGTSSGGARSYVVQRNGLQIMNVVETGTGSPLGVGHRGAGFGMHAGAALLTQATPAAVLTWGADDNATQTQSGFIARQNWGDQPRFDRVTCYGPGVFQIQDGPGSNNVVQFGPIYDGQVVQIRTDPRKRAVVDLTNTPPPPQQLNVFQQALADFVSFATANNVPPLLRSIESVFGINPPQGNLYSLLSGRFSDNSAIPAKPPGQQPDTYELAVSIVDGDANSRIVLAGTPLRRYPL